MASSKGMYRSERCYVSRGDCCTTILVHCTFPERISSVEFGALPCRSADCRLSGLEVGVCVEDLEGLASVFRD